jgi:alanyl-tRNA synthetase
VIVGTSAGGKTAVVVAVTHEFQARTPASRLAAKIGEALKGSGGGKPDLAQAGGKSEELLREGIRAGKEAIREMLAGSPETALKA